MALYKFYFDLIWFWLSMNMIVNQWYKKERCYKGSMRKI